MFSIRLPQDLETSLTSLSKQLNVNKSKVVIAALKNYIEDKQDYLKATRVFDKNNKKYTHEELLDELDL